VLPETIARRRLRERDFSGNPSRVRFISRHFEMAATRLPEHGALEKPMLE